MPNIARIFGRVMPSLFALCNLFNTSKKLRFFALRGARPVGLEREGTRTRIFIRVSSQFSATHQRVYSPLISLATYTRGLLSGISPRSIWRVTSCINFAFCSSERITSITFVTGINSQLTRIVVTARSV